jgi:hypothetical protein
MAPLTTGHPTWWVRIEAVGDTTAGEPNRLFRWSSAPPPSWDGDNLYRHALAEGSLQMSAQSIDPRTGKASSGGLTFSLIVPEDDPDEVRSIFGRLFYQQLGPLLNDISAQDVSGSTTVSIGEYTTGSIGDKIFINREVLTLGTHIGFGRYDFCQREKLETIKQHHRPGVPVYGILKVFDRRRVTVFNDPAAANNYTDEVEFASYQLWDGGQVGLSKYDFECDGFTAVLTDAELLKDQWVGRAHTREITESEADPRYLYIEHEPDYRGDFVRLPETLRSARTDANGGSAGERGGVGAEPAVGDIFDVAIDGTIYRARMTDQYETNAGGDVTQFVALVDLWSLPFGGVPVNVTRQTDLSRLDIREVFTSEPGGPSNNGSGYAQLPLGSGGEQHPLIIWLQVATSTLDGTNGAWDTGIDMGLRLPVSWIDTDAALALVDTDGENVRASRFFVGREDKPAAALKKLDDELLIPAGIQRTESVDGRISFTRITDSDYLTAAVDVTEAELVLAVELDEAFNYSRTLDKLLVQYDRDGSGKARKIPIIDNENTLERLGPEDKETIDGGSFQSRDLILATGIDYLVRWRNVLPGLSFGTTFDVNVRAGDAINLTTKAVLGYDRIAGVPVEGVTDSRVLITSRAPDIEANHIIYHGLHMGIRSINAANIAPAFLVDGVNVGEVVPVDVNHFVGIDHVRGYTDDIDPWEVGESAKLLDAVDMSVKEAGLTIGALASGSVTLTGLTVATVAGDFIVPDVYDTGTARQKARFIYWASALGLGAAPDPAKQYEG